MNRQERRKQSAIARKGKHVVGKQQIDVRRTTSALIKALTAEDPAQKQFWVEVALRLFLEDEWVDNAKKYFKWPDGVAPADIAVPENMQPKTAEVPSDERKNSDG